MGRDDGGGTTAEGRDQVQYDTALLASAGRASCGSEGATDFAIRGRIYDWFKAAKKRDYSGAEDPGVKSVKEIYTYYKHSDYRQK